MIYYKRSKLTNKFLSSSKKIKKFPLEKFVFLLIKETVFNTVSFLSSGSFLINKKRIKSHYKGKNGFFILT